MSSNIIDVPRPAKIRAGEGFWQLKPRDAVKTRALIVDLNNFSTFPTLAVGILVASLRNAGFDAQVICPLAYGAPAAERERRESLRDHLARRLYHSTLIPLRAIRDAAYRARSRWLNRPNPRTLAETAQAIAAGPDVILLSAYLQHYPTVEAIGRLAQKGGIPLILGGPVFNMTGTSDAWRRVPGLTAIVGGEVDLVLPDIVAAACAREDLLRFDGVLLPDGRRSSAAPPLQGLDRVPVPDFNDFPWDRYRFRVIPMMAGRGCQWAKCNFCSDVVSASGRTFRTRSVPSVLNEMREQGRRHNTSNFMFLDIKLNSHPGMFRGIIENVQRDVPGAQWIGTVHVDSRADNGLSRADLSAAAAAGMRRVSFGLESGSQRILDAMNKGCTVESNSEFIRNAYDAGLSVRCTMFKGYPGETEEDLLKTADFLEKHEQYIDRVRYNDFSIHEDTPIFAALRETPSDFPGMQVKTWEQRDGRLRYVNKDLANSAYSRANLRVLRAVHAINRRQLRLAANAFDGLM